jgi:hypothetical protein
MRWSCDYPVCEIATSSGPILAVEVNEAVERENLDAVGTRFENATGTVAMAHSWPGWLITRLGFSGGEGFCSLCKLTSQCGPTLILANRP